MADIELTAPDGHTFSAHRAEPDGPVLGAIVVIQEIFGVNAHIRSVADRFAADGYLAVAPALFDRIERGAELGYDEDGMARGAELAWNRLSIDDALTDLAATATALEAETGTPAAVGAVGFCYGGMLAAALSSRHPDVLGAAVAYYPSLASEKLVDDVPATPLLVHLGDQDQRVTVADGELLQRRWPTAEFNRYAEAGHGFNCDLRASFDPAAAADAWDRTLRFFGEHLGPTAHPGRTEPTA
jgi:carboxymethylenebutenolidase